MTSIHGLFRAIVLFKVIFVWALLCQAQSLSLEIPASIEKLETSAKKNSSSKTQTSGLLKVEGSQYASSIPGNSTLDQGLLTSVGLKTELETERTFSRADLTAERYVDWGASQFSVQELFWSRSWRDGQSQISVGRKLEYWSKADETWDLGLWQPDSVFDSLRPVEQGLTGVFHSHREGAFDSLAFLSPIFIPTMGPEVKEEDGNLVADSRWYRKPASTFFFNGKERPIVYSLNVPDLKELVQKPGVGYRLRYGADRPGFWAASSLGFKPMNSLLVKYDRKLESSEEGQDTGFAPLYPAVAYHTLWGMDLGYRFNESATEISLSYLEDRPQDIRRDADDPYILQRPSPARATSVQLDQKALIGWIHDPILFSLAYLQIDGGKYDDVDVNGGQHGPVFSQRLNFNRAAQIQAIVTGRLFQKKILSKLRYLREFEQKGMIASGEFQFHQTDKLILSMGADVLGVDDVSESNKDDRFLNQFRANDRIYGGVTYVY